MSWHSGYKQKGVLMEDINTPSRNSKCYAQASASLSIRILIQGYSGNQDKPSSCKPGLEGPEMSCNYSQY